MEHDTIYPTREDAQAAGGRFYQSAPCKRGHPGVRFTSTRACRDCTREDGLKRRADAAFQAAENERRKAWREANPEAWLAGKRRYRERHPDKVREYNERKAAESAPARAAAAEAKRLEREAEKERKRLAKAAEKVAKAADREREMLERAKRNKRTKKLKRYLRERDAPGSHTDEEAAWLLNLQRGGCAYCGVNDNLQKDHKDSLAEGGSNDISNIQWLCKPHNTEKWTRSDAAYREMIGVPPVTPWDAQAGLLLLLAAAAA